MDAGADKFQISMVFVCTSQLELRCYDIIIFGQASELRNRYRDSGFISLGERGMHTEREKP